ncbi:hypothetical protein O5D80_001643 [Batrachochytrium dendrobatidis]|nr:hypothetical protein O5D80_001643 [Batrachochytrium dendrobatidis]
MKLPIAVLSSILLICSVTTANPIHHSTTTYDESSFSTVIPSVTTSTEFNPSETPNTSGAGLSSLDLLSDGMENLLESYSKKQHGFDEHGEKCKLIKLQLEDQRQLIKDLKKRIDDLKSALLKSNDNPNYNRQVQELELELGKQHSKLEDLEKSHEECNIDSGRLNFELELIKISLVECFSGKPFNFRSLNEQLLLILSHSLVKEYLYKLESIDKLSSGCKECSRKKFQNKPQRKLQKLQKLSAQQNRQSSSHSNTIPKHSQQSQIPSKVRPTQTPFNSQGTFKFMNRLKSFFK